MTTFTDLAIGDYMQKSTLSLFLQKNYRKQFWLMPMPVTYNLSPAQHTGNFYKDLHRFTNDVWVMANIQFGTYVTDYYRYIIKNELEPPRTKDEYLLEIVITGVLVRNYYAKAQKTNLLSTKLLSELYKLRKQNQRLKSVIDKLRGILSYVLLNKKQQDSGNFSPKGFTRLLKWLSATGEFNEEVIRLTQWDSFYKLKTKAYFRSLVNSAVVFAGYFESKGEEQLGSYVCNVNHFLQNKLATYRYKEDYFFVSRCRNEYFMNMFGADIMNRCLKEGFRNMPNKAVLLPTCMQTPPETGCMARHDGKELVCRRCSRDCNIGKIATVMKKHKVKSYLIPHSSGFSKFLQKWENNTDTGLVGVTCILNLLAGGYEMRRLNISSQCIFLDYCACKKHWDKKGPATSLNLQQLIEIVSEARH
jgi:hypothetical protein